MIVVHCIDEAGYRAPGALLRFLFFEFYFQVFKDGVRIDG